MKDSKNGQKTGKNKPPVDKQFTSEHQPDSALKRQGWAKKRRGRELVQHILSMPFKGTEEYRQKIAEYFGIDPNEITNEEMILFKQAEKAMKTGDSRSAELLLDRAHGKPMQPTQLDVNVIKPVIIDFSGTDDNETTKT